MNNLLPQFQSAYRPHHSVETAVIKVLADILLAIDKGDLAGLALLDLSAAFDTVVCRPCTMCLYSDYRLPVVSMAWRGSGSALTLLIVFNTSDLVPVYRRRS